jgi:acetyl esterase/lipase
MIRMRLRVFVFSAIALVATNAGARAQQAVLPLWPHGTPEPAQVTGPERDMTTPEDKLVSGRRSIRYTDVTKPTLSVYPPPGGGSELHAAALVFPGGSYIRLVWDGEGLDTCKWLNSIGMTCLLVKYRVPEVDRYPKNPADFEDAQQAMRIARAHAAEWRIDPAKIGTVGYSAGAHLEVELNTHADDPHVMSTPAARDVDASISAQPNFVIVVYPGWLRGSGDSFGVEKSVQPTKSIAPTFVLQAEDDPVHVENSLAYYLALKEAGVPAEMHLYATGGHGFGVYPAGSPEEHWTELATTWLRSIGMIR